MQQDQNQQQNKNQQQNNINPLYNNPNYIDMIYNTMYGQDNYEDELNRGRRTR